MIFFYDACILETLNLGLGPQESLSSVPSTLDVCILRDRSGRGKREKGQWLLLGRAPPARPPPLVSGICQTGLAEITYFLANRIPPPPNIN